MVTARQDADKGSSERTKLNLSVGSEKHVVTSQLEKSMIP